MVHMMKNTDKVYPCVHCGSTNANIIREGADPRLKCNACNGTYDASQSKSAEEAGAIPDGAPKKEDTALNPRLPAKEAAEVHQGPLLKELVERQERARIPRLPAYALISKDRKHVEYTTKKNLKKIVLAWESRESNYDLYKLEPTKAEVKVEFE